MRLEASPRLLILVRLRRCDGGFGVAVDRRFFRKCTSALLTLGCIARMRHHCAHVRLSPRILHRRRLHPGCGVECLDSFRYLQVGHHRKAFFELIRRQHLAIFGNEKPQSNRRTVNSTALLLRIGLEVTLARFSLLSAFLASRSSHSSTVVTLRARTRWAKAGWASQFHLTPPSSPAKNDVT